MKPKLLLITVLSSVQLICWLSGCSSNTSISTKQEAKLPNILWIVGENFKLDFGCYGAENVYTPHIDSLANHGMKFTRVFATSPVCAPSRSAFMTGMYQTTTDMHHMRSHRDDDYQLPQGVRPLTHRLQDAGYFTANISRIKEYEVGTGKLDLNFANEGQVYQSEDWASLKQNQTVFCTNKHAGSRIRYLR